MIIIEGKLSHCFTPLIHVQVNCRQRSTNHLLDELVWDVYYAKDFCNIPESTEDESIIYSSITKSDRNERLTSNF